MVVGYVAVAVTPLDTLAIWTGDTTIQLVAIGQLLLICLGLYVSFLPIGMCISALFARRPDDINRLYFSDLAGAALACLVVVPLVATIGPVSIIAVVAIVLLALGIQLTGTTHKTVLGVAIAAAGLLARDRHRARHRAVDPHRGEQGRPAGHAIAASEWSAAVPGRRASVPRQHRALSRRDLGFGDLAVGRRPGLPRPDSTPTTVPCRSPRSATRRSVC